jgi:hypothetical protein
MKLIKNLTFAALAATLLFQTPITWANDHGSKGHHGPQHITFEKCFVADAGHFEGTVGGDYGAGTVVFTYLSVISGTPIVRFSGEYAIATPDCSIKTVCAGMVDTRTGHIVLNGVVTDGPLLGDRVQVRAQLNALGNCSAGTMTITPFERE